MTITEKQVRAFINHLFEKEHTFVKDEGEGCFTIDGCVNVAAALEAVFADAQPAPSVAVKALEWEAREDGSHCGTSAIGHYHVFPGTGFSYDLCGPVGGRLSTHKRLSEAKAAAQSDYEARIRSALSAQVQDVAGAVIKLGTYGRAYDRPEERRAYTYEHQPGNIEAHKLGRACSDIHSGGDWIDRGLNLLNALQREGFGVFELPAAPAKPVPLSEPATVHECPAYAFPAEPDRIVHKHTNIKGGDE